MRTFFKVLAMGAVVVSGSLLALALTFTDRHLLAGLALVGTLVAAIVVIRFIVRDTENAPIDDGSGRRRVPTPRRTAS